jgi:hypothetical protein
MDIPFTYNCHRAQYSFTTPSKWKFKSESVPDGTVCIQGRFFFDPPRCRNSNMKVTRYGNKLYLWGCYSDKNDYNELIYERIDCYLEFVFNIKTSAKWRWEKLASHFMLGDEYYAGPQLEFVSGFFSSRGSGLWINKHDFRTSTFGKESADVFELNHVTAKYDHGGHWRVDCGELPPFWCRFKIPDESLLHYTNQLIPHLFPEFQSLVLEFAGDMWLHLYVGDIEAAIKLWDSRLSFGILPYPGNSIVVCRVNIAKYKYLLQEWKQCPDCGYYQDNTSLCKQCLIKSGQLVRFPDHLRRFLQFHERDIEYVKPERIANIELMSRPVIEHEERMELYGRTPPDSENLCSKVIGKGNSKRLCRNRRRPYRSIIINRHDPFSSYFFCTRHAKKRCLI